MNAKDTLFAISVGAVLISGIFLYVGSLNGRPFESSDISGCVQFLKNMLLWGGGGAFVAIYGIPRLLGKPNSAQNENNVSEVQK